MKRTISEKTRKKMSASQKARQEREWNERVSRDQQARMATLPQLPDAWDVTKKLFKIKW